MALFSLEIWLSIYLSTTFIYLRGNPEKDMSRYALQLTLRSHEFLYLCKLVVKLEAFGVEQCSRRLDDLARHDLLHWQLHLLHVDSSLRRRNISIAEPDEGCYQRREDAAYRNLMCLEDILWNMSGTQFPPDGRLHLPHQFLGELHPGPH